MVYGVLCVTTSMNGIMIMLQLSVVNSTYPFLVYTMKALKCKTVSVRELGVHAYI